MALKNRSMYAILGILTLSPGTGYDIKKYSDDVLSGFWNENFGHIYPTLKRMVMDETIEVVNRPRRDRKIVYGITEKGRKEFRAWLIEDTAQQPARSEFLLKLLFSSALPRENVIQTLEKYRAQQEEKRNTYRDMEKKLLQGIPEIAKERIIYLRAVLRRGILSNEAAIAWCAETIETLMSIEDGMRV